MISNIEKIQIIKYDIEVAKNKLKKIQYIWNLSEEHEYYRDSLEYLVKYNSMDINKEKYRLSVNYMILVDPEKYFKRIKNKIRTNKCINCKSFKHMKTISPGIYQCSRCMYITSDISENILISDINPNGSIEIPNSGLGSVNPQDVSASVTPPGHTKQLSSQVVAPLFTSIQKSLRQQKNESNFERNLVIVLRFISGLKYCFSCNGLRSVIAGLFKHMESLSHKVESSHIAPISEGTPLLKSVGAPY